MRSPVVTAEKRGYACKDALALASMLAAAGVASVFEVVLICAAALVACCISVASGGLALVRTGEEMSAAVDADVVVVATATIGVVLAVAVATTAFAGVTMFACVMIPAGAKPR